MTTLKYHFSIKWPKPCLINYLIYVHIYLYCIMYSYNLFYVSVQLINPLLFCVRSNSNNCR